MPVTKLSILFHPPAKSLSGTLKILPIKLPVVARSSVRGEVRSDEPLLVLNTGSGLKDVKAAMQAVVEAPVIEPTLEAVKKLL